MVELVDDGPTDFDGDLDPESMDENWVYTEKFIYMPHCTFFFCHDCLMQAAPLLKFVPSW
jgi:hypothetical protein